MDPVASNYDDESTTSVPSLCDYPADLYGADHFDCDGSCVNDTDGMVYATKMKFQAV